MRFSARNTAMLLITGCLVIVGWGCALGGGSRPSTPHPPDGPYADCRTCHEEGLNGAPKTDHAKKADCLSCHPVFIRQGTQQGTQ